MNERAVALSMFPELVSDKPVGPIPPSVMTGTNADLIARVADLYLTGSVVDLTYGEGKWWDRYCPAEFVAHDLHKVDGVDFTNLPEDDNTYDTACFDPPYVISGTASSEALGPEFQNRYGIGLHNLAAKKTATGSQRFEDMLRGGLLEAARVSRRWVLVKCMEFAQGSHASVDFHDIPYLMTKWALEDAGMVKHDQIVHHTGSGPGGHNIWTPKRARRHHSYLLVFRHT